MNLPYKAIFFAVILLSTLVMPITFADAKESSSSVDEIQFQLKVNQTYSLESDNIKVKFLNVTADSRCPSDVTCIWQGESKIFLNIVRDSQDLGSFSLTSRPGEKDPVNQVFDGHLIHVVKIEPYPTSHTKIQLSDYIVTFMITKSEILSPHKQFKSGTISKDVKCKDGFHLVMKATDNSPACVKPSSIITLISWGWAKSINDDTQNMAESQTSNKIITLADNGKSIALHKGESFLLKLGEDHTWNIDLDNQTVVSRVMNIMPVRGAQGVYDAHNDGQTTLTGVGDPLCLTSVPSCKMPSIQFKLNVIVQSSDKINSEVLVVSTEKEQYGIGEPINIIITDNGNTRLFPIGWGYSIDGSDGKHYAPTGVLKMMLVALTSGNSTHWIWNQMDGNNTQVNTGKYNITASYTEENTQKQISSSKMIEVIR